MITGCLLVFAFAGTIRSSSSTSALALSSSSSSPTQEEYRLPKVVLPELYDIAIKPYLRNSDGAKQFTFDGEVNITLHSIAKGVKSIILHTDRLDIMVTALFDANDILVEHFDATRLLYNSITNMLTVHLTNPLEYGVAYKLYFQYTGQIRSDLGGVFRGSYSKDSWYAVTQFQRIEARTAFPCFDEPAFKAKFRMRIRRPITFRSYFNTRLRNTTPYDTDYYVDNFEESPLMSTYLVAFLVGSEFISYGYSSDYKFIMNFNLTGNTNYALEVGEKVLQAFNNYTRIPYKTLGNDIMQSAGSVRFPHNGMENWGLVIYRDSVLSQEPGYTDGWIDKELTVTIMTHETAHMWFGNSVTFQWWSYFWLNEGFARYYQYFMANEIYPEFELDKRFVVNQIQTIFGTDATNSTQPLTSPEHSIQSPAQIAYKFSGIAYAKGASFVRMVCNLMGKENFVTAIRDYLIENHLHNTVPTDLFRHWKMHWPAGHNVDLDEFFSDWTEQVGYPMLSVGITYTGQYSLKQQRFLLDPSDGSDPNLLYTTPITFATNKENNFNDLTPKFYLNKTLKEVHFGNASSDNWIIFNLQQSNYHRVFYDTPLLKKIYKAFMDYGHDKIHEINRANIVDDLFTYGRTGLMGYDEVFEFMEYLSTETRYLPWQPAFNGLQFIHRHLTLTQSKNFGKFVFKILEPLYTIIGFAQEHATVPDVYLQNYVISWLCKYHYTQCNDEAQRIFRVHAMANTKPSPDFRETLYCAACRDATFDIYQTLAHFYATETPVSEKEKLLRAMGCNRHFVEYHYAFVLLTNVTEELKPMAIRSMYTQTAENVTPVFRCITATLEHLANVLDSWSTTAAVISDIAGYFTTHDQLKMLKELIATNGHLFGSAVITLEDAVLTVEENLDWSKKRLGKLFHYLDRGNGATSLQLSATLAMLTVTAMLGL